MRANDPNMCVIMTQLQDQMAHSKLLENLYIKISYARISGCKLKVRRVVRLLVKIVELKQNSG